MLSFKSVHVRDHIQSSPGKALIRPGFNGVGYNFEKESDSQRGILFPPLCNIMVNQPHASLGHWSQQGPAKMEVNGAQPYKREVRDN